MMMKTGEPHASVVENQRTPSRRSDVESSEESFIKLKAHAKINLSLRVFTRDLCGYHPIETLMAPVTLADELQITHLQQAARSTILLHSNDSSLPSGEENLCVKAARIFQKKNEYSSTNQHPSLQTYSSGSWTWRR